MDNIATVADQTSEAFSSTSKGNTQAMMELGQLWVAGFRKFSNIMGTASQAHFDHVTTTIKAMCHVRTVQGALELQMAAACTSIAQAVANSNKLSTASMELADQGMAPLKARMEKAVARFSSMNADLA